MTAKLKREEIPADFEVRPLEPGEYPKGRTECGSCGLAWDDDIVTSYTPAPAARCPFEHWHEPEPESKPSRGRKVWGWGYRDSDLMTDGFAETIEETPLLHSRLVAGGSLKPGPPAYVILSTVIDLVTMLVNQVETLKGLLAVETARTDVVIALAESTGIEVCLGDDEEHNEEVENWFVDGEHRGKMEEEEEEE